MDEIGAGTSYYDKKQDLINLLNPLHLEDLSDEWVRDIWDREFMDNIELPQDYGAFIRKSNFIPVIQKIKDNLSSLIICDSNEEVNEDDPNNTESWKSLVNVIKHEKLIALLFYLIYRGECSIADKHNRLCGIQSARLYMVMLIIPGSKAYSIFHCQMYVTCLKIFKFADRLLDTEEEFNDYDICSHVNILNKQTHSGLLDLCALIKNFNLKSDSVTLEETVCCLVDLTNNPLMNCRLNIDKLALENNSKIAFECLDKLIQAKDKEADQLVIFTIFKFLLPKFTATDKLTRKSLLSSSNSGFAYCSTLLTKYGDAVIEGLTCFIQHLCCDSTGMERCENRLFRVKIIIGLLSHLPLQAYSDQLKWIIKLSHSSNSTWRSLALEVIGFILAGEDRNANVFDENEDFSSTSMNMAVDEDKSEEEQPAISLKYNVGHKDLLKVVVERCQDVSCTVRMNALSILVTCTTPTHANLNEIIKELFDDDDTLLEIAEQKLKDERANVRKSAMKLIENILKVHEKFLIRKNLQFLVRLCRDASISVRICAINVLTGLTMHWRNATVADAWLDGALNQLSDPENKVQELVLDALRNLLFSDLVSYSMTSSGAVRFPWILLNAIVRKNMRRHLSHACLMLSKNANNKILKPQLIDVLSTHVRTENNLSCWIILSCVARHIIIKDISFVIDYFNDRSTDPLFGDIRLLILVQEVLCEWCLALSNQDSKSLHTQLVQALRYGTIPSGATRGSITLAMRLSRDDNTWAIALMEEYENKILSQINCEEEQDSLGGSLIATLGDIALASDKKPSLEIIELLLNIVGSFDSLNCDNISLGTRSAALIALGKLSLKDKIVATQVTQLCANLVSSTTCALSLRINAMCILADMSIRFTSIVEPKLPGMFMSLASPNLTIRRMAVQLITQLLVSDFLKLRDSLYFHYFSLVCDADEKIRDIATYYLLQCLVNRDKNILYNNFIKAVFYFNNYEDPLSFKKFQVSDEERKLFSLQGDDKRNSRCIIYDMMLSHMSNLQRLNTQVRLCNQAISVGESGTDGTDVLKDSLDILRKISRYNQTKEQNDDLAVRVANNIVAQKMKLNEIEKVVPMVMRLYRQLKMINSPLVPNVVGYACDLLKEYRQEIEEVFDSDVDLLNEIKQFQANSDDVFLQPTESNVRKERRPSKTPAKSTSKREGSSSSKKSGSATTTPRKRKSCNDSRNDAKRRLNLADTEEGNESDD